MEIDLKPYWEWATWIAEQRHEQKKNFKSHKKLSDNYEIVGVLGEIVYALTIGEPIDSRLLINGDGGYDFKNKTNVKTSEEIKNLPLITFIEEKVKPNLYVYVLVNLEKKTGYIRGWISAQDFDSKYKIKDFKYGDRRCVELSELNTLETYQPFIDKIISQFNMSQDILINKLAINNPKLLSNIIESYNKTTTMLNEKLVQV